jgi:hypothetical protein
MNMGPLIINLPTSLIANIVVQTLVRDWTQRRGGKFFQLTEQSEG